MAYSNSTSLPRFNRLVLLLFSLSSAVLYLGYTGYEATRPRYPAGSLPPDARGGGAGACRMTFMSPSYFHLAGFNKNETRLGNGPWGLYLYREAGWDQDPIQEDGRGGEKVVLNGTPVLFVPGNAGSFKQVRSLASTATRMFWELPGMKREGAEWIREGGGGGSTSLDFFTLDFNDDFSAFHGQTLFDQAEYTADAIRYVLSLYKGQTQPGPDPTSVILVAHSMGGIVARAVFLDSRYQSKSISTLVTFATPHLLPPVTVDSGVDHFYSSINRYWSKAYSISAPPAAFQELAEVVTISISGGISDEMIASETASLSSLVPADGSNGFAVSTTSIPGVQTPMDHLAILWCQQLMQVVANSLLSIVDSRHPSKVVSRQERINVFNSRLLGAIERKDLALEIGQRFTLESIERGNPSNRLGLNERLTVRPGGGGGRITYLLPVPSSKIDQQFSLLTSADVGFEKVVQVHGCSGSEGVECSPPSSENVSILPASPHNVDSPVLPAAVGDETMNLVTFETQALARFSHIAVVVTPGPTTWVVAEFTEEAEQGRVVDRGLLYLLLTGYQGEIDSKSMISEVRLPMLDTSLLTLKLRIDRNSCREKDSLFAPLLRQYSTSLHESKFYPNVRRASLYTHAFGPYLPRSSPNPGARLQFFLDPTCSTNGENQLTFEVTVDVLKTIGNLFVRYRMALVTIPAALTVLIVAIQVREYNSGHSFPSFDTALAVFARQYLLPLLGLLLGLGYLQTLLLGGDASSATGSSTWIRDALLGTAGAFWAPFLPLLLLASFAVLVLEYLALSSLVNVISWTARALARKSRVANSLFSAEANSAHLSPLQRTTAIAFLLLFTIFFAPCQFAYLVLFPIHLLTTVRLLVSIQPDSEYVKVEQPDEDSPCQVSPSTSDTDVWDQFNFSFSILFLLLSLLPLNALILVVWVRNLAVGWFAPFSSDHQVLSIVGFLALVESLHSGKMLPRTNQSSWISRITFVLGLISASYSLIYGIRTAYRLLTLANIFCGWLAFLMNGGRFLSFLDRAEPTKEGLKDEPSRKVATTARSAE